MTQPKWQGIYKLQEEMNELGVVLSKMCQRPDMDYWDTDLSRDLIDEITDVQQAIDYFVKRNGIELDQNRYQDKKQKYLEWQDQDPPLKGL